MPEKTPVSWRRRAKSAALAVGIGLGLVAVTELALRSAGFEREPARRFDLSAVGAAGPPQYLTHPTRLWSLAPGHRQSAEHAGRYALAEWPFRGRPGLPSPAHVARVGVIGDSCVYGACLFVAETLPERLALELSAAGWGPERVQVLNLGVPGYTVVQMRALVAELAAGELAFDALVVAPAAWNDQGPARGADDLEWRAARSTLRGWLARTALAELARRALGLERPLAAAAGIESAEGGGRPRVPEAALPAELDLLFAECRALAPLVVAIVAAHPAATIAQYPRVERDAQAVREAAGRARIEAVDAGEVWRGAALADGELFADYVHPAPQAQELLARAVAPLVVRGLPRREGAPAAPFWIESFTPTTASALGDVDCELRLGGWGESADVPAVLVGGAPLLGIEVVGPGRFRGTLQANAPGKHALVVQTRRGVASRPAALELLAPTLTGERGPPAFLVFTSRPGDRARVAYSAQQAKRPLCSSMGASWIDPATVGVLPELLEAGPDGVARLLIEKALSRGVCLQAVAIPRGTDEASGVGMLTPPLVVH